MVLGARLGVILRTLTCNAALSQKTQRCVHCTGVCTALVYLLVCLQMFSHEQFLGLPLIALLCLLGR